MARVVSWRVDFGSTTKYAYITDGNGNAPLINDSQLDQSTANRIGSVVLGWNQDKYVYEFGRMQTALDAAISEHVDLGSANKYWNITEYEEGGLKQVLMLVGADGKNTSSELSSYYTFHLVNQAAAIGTGDDYRLDSNAAIDMEAFMMDREGNKFPCDSITVSEDNFSVSDSAKTSESTTFKLIIANGTTFNDSTHSIGCVIHGSRTDGGYGKAMFTVTAVLGGKEGVSYDLVVAPKQFHFSSPQEVAESTGMVNVGVLMNGKSLSTKQIASEGLSIGYEYDVNGSDGFYDADDIATGTIKDNGRMQIAPLSIYNNGGSVTFYLMSNGSVVDSDSASVVVDGEDGLGTIKVELDNEVEAIGVGNDDVLDLPNGVSVTASTNVRMYSGETTLRITGIEVRPSTVNSEHWEDQSITGLGAGGDFYGTIQIILKHGFTLGSDLRDKITLDITGEHPSSSTLSVTRSCAFTIIGVKSGKDGVIYRLVPSCDYIMYDPNQGLIQCESGEAFPVTEMDGKTISASVYAGNYIQSAEAVAADNGRVTYTTGITYSSAESAYRASVPTVSGLKYEVPISEIFGDLDNGSLQRYITFYWTKLIGNDYYLIDRETVPVISAGLNGEFVKIELGNEIDAITIGDDTVLDIEEGDTVEVGTTIRAVAADLSDLDIVGVTSSVIQDYNGWHSDSDEWPAAQYEVSDDNGVTWNSTDGSAHKMWRFYYELPNGFDFGDDKKEKVKIDVTYSLEDGTENTGSAIFTIVGVPGGKEGRQYRLVPEVDIVRYFANDDVFDEEEVVCDAIIGLERLEDGHIYYGQRVRTEEGYRVLDIIGDDFGNNYAAYINSVNVRDMYFGTDENFEGPTNQIAFYLTIDTDDGELIVDHETVSIVSDGKDGDSNISVELSNEIESISTGTDTSLGDLGNDEFVTASTKVHVLYGNEKIEIRGFDYEWIDAPTQNSVNSVKLYNLAGTTEVLENGGGDHDGEIASGSNRGKYTELEVVLNNKFDFGSGMRKRLILKLKYMDATTETEKWARGLFTLIGIKGGKDGSTYRIVPTPDFVVYDFGTQGFPGQNSVAVAAYCNGQEMNASDYEIYYSEQTIYDLSSVQVSNLTRFNGTYSFAAPRIGEEKRVVFYLKVGNQFVDRETVPLITNGRNGTDGKDGEGSFRFDLVNPLEVLNTGNDNVLNTTKTYTCIAYGYAGTTPSPINVQVSGAETKCSISTGSTADGGVSIDVTLSNGFTFDPDTMKKEFDIAATSANDSSLVGHLKFTLIAVMNGTDGDDAEGDSYRLRTNVSSVVYDGNEVSPKDIQAAVYLGSTLQKCDIFFYYWEGDANAAQIGLETIMLKSTYTGKPKISYGSSSSSITGLTISGDSVQNNIITATPVSSGTIYIAAFDGDTILDYDDIPVTVANLGGGSSGILADLTDDVGVVATGGDKKLEAGAVLKTKVSVRSGFDPLQITGLKISNNPFPYTYTATNGGTITFSIGALQTEEVEITATISAGASNYIDFSTTNPLQFNITISAKTAEEEDVYASVGYSILGLKGGKDGWTVNLELNSNQVFYDANKTAGQRFSPSEIIPKLFINGEVVSEGVTYQIKNSDMGDPSVSELWLEFDSQTNKFTITEDNVSEFNPLTVRALSAGTLMDWETVQIYRNGKDGEGGLEVQVAPSIMFIPVEDGRPKSVFVGRSMVGLFTGSTQDSIDSITASTTYGSFGLEGSGTHVTYRVEDGTGKYKWVSITASTSTDLSAPIDIMLSVKSATDGSIRYGSITLNPSSGGKGERGPKTRLRDWKVGDSYQAGGSNDEFWDYVYNNGKYYGCKVNNTGAAANEPGSGNSWEDYWEEYEGATFTASKIAFFGDQTSGWVIDSSEIIHTTSSITLDGSNAAIEIRDPNRKVYEYSNGDKKIYTTYDFKDQNVFYNFYTDYVTVYSDTACTERIVNVYKLSGSTDSPTLVIDNSAKIIPIRIANSNTTLYPYISSEDLADEDITVDIKYELYVETSGVTTYSYSSNASSNYSSFTASISVYECENESTIYAGKTSGTTKFNVSLFKTSTGYSDSEGAITGETFWDSVSKTINLNEFWDEKFGYHPASLIHPSVGDRLVAGAKVSYYYNDVLIDGEIDDDHVSVDPIPFDRDDKDVNVNSSYYTKTFVIITEATISSCVNTSPYKYGCRIYSPLTTGVLYYTDGETKGSDLFYEQKPQANTNVEVYSYASDVQIDGDSLPLTAVINGWACEDSEYGNLVLAAGVNGSQTDVYSWTGGGSTAYTMGDLSNVEIDSDVSLYFNDGNYYYEYLGKKVNSDEIEYDGVTYTRSGDPSTLKSAKLANTRIYKDGSLITSKLYATDGFFNGALNADSGRFYGGLEASNCNISEASIRDSYFEGTVKVPNGDMLSVLNQSDDTIFSASNNEINASTRSFAASVFSREDNGAFLGLGTKTNTNVEYTLISLTSVTGSTIKFPSFTLTVTGKKIKSGSAKLKFSGVSGLDEVTLSNKFSTTGGSYTWTGVTSTTSSATVKVSIIYSFSIGGTNGKIKMYGKFGGQIEVGSKRTTPYYAFGKNGLYLTDGRYGAIQIGSDGVGITYGSNEIWLTSSGIAIGSVYSNSNGSKLKYTLNLSEVMKNSVGSAYLKGSIVTGTT